MGEQSLKQVLEVSREGFLAAQTPGMNFDTEHAFAYQLLMGSDSLMKAARNDQLSLNNALANVASIGLTLNPAAKEAYLVPRGGKVCLDPGYIGLCKLATDSKAIKWVQAKPVHAQDTFTDHGPGSKPEHVYEAFKPRGDVVGFYCVAKLSGENDEYLTSTMTLDEVNAIKNRSPAGNRGPWKTDFNEMAKKTVIRQASKLWPKGENTRLAQAVQLSNENEGFEPIATSPDIDSYNTEQKELFDQLITNSDALGMYVFMQGLDESIQVSLNRSFKQGEKGTYQKIVNALISKGRDQFSVYVDEIRDSLNRGDDENCHMLMDELEQPAQKLMYEHLTSEHELALREIMDNANR